MSKIFDKSLFCNTTSYTGEIFKLTNARLSLLRLSLM